MCRSQAEGGQRCSAHTGTAYRKAITGTAGWDQAAAEHASTPGGRAEIEQRVDLRDAQVMQMEREMSAGLRRSSSAEYRMALEDLAGHRKALDMGAMLRQANADARAAIVDARSTRSEVPYAKERQTIAQAPVGSAEWVAALDTLSQDGDMADSIDHRIQNASDTIRAWEAQQDRQRSRWFRRDETTTSVSEEDHQRAAAALPYLLRARKQAQKRFHEQQAEAERAEILGWKPYGQEFGFGSTRWKQHAAAHGATVEGRRQLEADWCNAVDRMAIMLPLIDSGEWNHDHPEWVAARERLHHVDTAMREGLAQWPAQTYIPAVGANEKFRARIFDHNDPRATPNREFLAMRRNYNHGL